MYERISGQTLLKTKMLWAPAINMAILDRVERP